MNMSTITTLAYTAVILLASATAFSTKPAPSTNLLFSQHGTKKESSKDEMVLTYLEINGYIMTTAGVTILIDPVLEGPLDFGIPDLYTGQKKSLPASGLCESLPPIDCILITQGLDDHAHVRTLTKLAARKAYMDVPIVAPPSARAALEKSGMMNKAKVRFLRHGQRTTVHPKEQQSKKNGVMIQATSGALVGPPWQTRENGYILRPTGGVGARAPSVYIEPHVEFDRNELLREAPVDVVITPTVGQRLPILDLVYGPENTIRLLETLRPKVVISMPNHDVEATGIVAPIVQTVGSKSEFLQRLQRSSVAGTKVLDLIPGQDQSIQV
jgi:L-ascorbate metabolism protein UlaG (beta-lactamase superfamily)